MSEKLSAEDYLQHLKNKTILEVLDTKTAKPGDVFFIDTGTIHAIGAGIVIAEIQQTSDITYRVYDFDRVDVNGNLRDLHVDLALEAINYNPVQAQKQYNKVANVSNEIVNCQYFTTNIIPLNHSITVHKNQESFTVYMCVDGDFQIVFMGETFNYKKGDTVLLPAFLTDFQLIGNASILEIYIS